MANNVIIKDATGGSFLLKTVYDPTANVHLSLHQIGAANTSTVARVPAAGVPTSLLATNNARLGVEFYNDSNGVVWVLRGLGTVSNANYSFQLNARDYFSENPTTFTGVYSAIWQFANGAIMTTELTA